MFVNLQMTIHNYLHTRKVSKNTSPHIQQIKHNTKHLNPPVLLVLLRVQHAHLHVLFHHQGGLLDLRGGHVALEFGRHARPELALGDDFT